jgi:type III pantothenate kinase
MLLCIDISNAVIAIGVFDREKEGPRWRMSAGSGKTSDEYGIQISQFMADRGIDRRSISGIVLGSVVPPLTRVLTETCQEYFDAGPLVVDAGIRTGLKLRFDNPKEIGADRIANAVAVKARGTLPACIVDFETATVFDGISAEGEYTGGAIAPGIGIASQALFEHTAKLPRVELTRPESVIGKNTPDSIRSGLMFGYIGLVEGMVARFKAALGPGCSVVATGTYAALLAGETKAIDVVDPWLTLNGLRILYDMNAGKERG